MELVAEGEIVSRTCHSTLCDIEVALQDEVVSELLNGKQALETCVHVAEEGVVLESNDAVFVVWQGCQPLLSI